MNAEVRSKEVLDSYRRRCSGTASCRPKRWSPVANDRIGSIASVWRPALHFRSTPIDEHGRTSPTGLVCATGRHTRRFITRGKLGAERVAS
jgi:hypothetical protein